MALPTARRGIAPASMGSTASALYLCVRNLLGGLGPLMVAGLIGPLGLQHAMMVVPAMYLGSGLIFGKVRLWGGPGWAGGRAAAGQAGAGAGGCGLGRCGPGRGGEVGWRGSMFRWWLRAHDYYIGCEYVCGC